MFESVESIHNKITTKLSARKVLDPLRQIVNKCRVAVAMRTGHKYATCAQMLRDINIDEVSNALGELEDGYALSVVNILSEYYCGGMELKNTKEYHKIITSENYLIRIDYLISSIKSIINLVHIAIQCNIMSSADTKNMISRINDISKTIDRVHSIKIITNIEKRPLEICKCGMRRTIVPELSELRCDNPLCSHVKTIVGAVFRDDQFYPQDGQKSKHGGYDTARHHKFWMERLQARESKVFKQEDLDNIKYVIDRDNYNRSNLTCEIMRKILKDPKVNATYLNNHTALLVKTFGGPAPPQLDFNEDKLSSNRFAKAMRLYEIINPDDNKPYYPYFIHKILEVMFKDMPEKLRILDYIHLQSRETVIKNDKIYKEMCSMSNDPGLVYSATDPTGRL